MRPGFIGDPQIPAGRPPFGAVRRDPATAGASLGEQMRQFMAQGSVDFSRAMLAQARIQRDEIPAKIRAARGAEKPGIPFHLDRCGQLRRAKRFQHLPGRPFELGIAPQDDEQEGRRENQIELVGAELVVRLQGTAV